MSGSISKLSEAAQVVENTITIIGAESEVGESSKSELGSAMQNCGALKEYFTGLVGFLSENEKPYEEEAALMTTMENTHEAIAAQIVMIETLQESINSSVAVLEEAQQAIQNAMTA